MDWFLAAFWVTMIVGVAAVAVPAYWLASGWWQDRASFDTLAAPVANDPSITASVRVLTAGETLAQPIFDAATRASSSYRFGPDELSIAVSNEATITPSSGRILTAGEALL
jgi:hypothetical protein